MVIWLLLNEIITRPIFNLLIVSIALFGGNLWIGIILLTLVVKLVFLKSSMQWMDMSKGMGNLQPKMQELQEKYKDDPKKLSEETMKLLKKEWAWPLKWCMGMLVQMPILIGLYAVIRSFAKWSTDFSIFNWYTINLSDQLYSFFKFFGVEYVNLDNISSVFLWIDLLEPGSVVITVAAVVFMYGNMKLMSIVKPMQAPAVPWAKMPDMGKMMWFMHVMFAFMMIPVVYPTAAGIGLYIATTSLFSIIQFLIQYRVVVKAKLRAAFSK